MRNEILLGGLGWLVAGALSIVAQIDLMEYLHGSGLIYIGFAALASGALVLIFNKRIKRLRKRMLKR